MDAGSLWKRVPKIAVAVCSISRCGEIGRTTVGEIRAGFECVVTRAGTGAAQIGSGKEGLVAAGSAVEASALHADDGSPGKARVNVQDAAEGPAPSDLF